MNRHKKKSYLASRRVWIPLILVLCLLALIREGIMLSKGPDQQQTCGPASLPGDTFPQPYPLATSPTRYKTDLLSWIQKGGMINDASCLNETTVHGILTIETTADIRAALSYAKKHDLKVSIAGMRHSMGGQIMARNALVVDMRSFDTISINPEQKTATVQSGAIWHDIQLAAAENGLAVKAMQSSDVFTVGGSISVNAHGMDHHAGSVAQTIRSLRIMQADGKIQTLSPTKNPTLFRLVIGGYGLFGVILDAEIELTDNIIYQSQRKVLSVSAFPDYFARHVANSPELGLFYGHFSTAPRSFFREMLLYEYRKTDQLIALAPALKPVGAVNVRRFFLNVAKTGSIGQQVKWWAERDLEPWVSSCTTTRAEAMTDAEACFTSRNQVMHDHVPYLRTPDTKGTDILQEYFIPQPMLLPFTEGMRNIFINQPSTLLNAGVRIVHKEDIFLSYASEDMFSIVLYLHQKRTQVESDKMKRLTRALTDLSIQVGGRPYLPYQLSFTDKQLRQSYPMIDQFFRYKRHYDPNLLFINRLYTQYAQG